LSVPSAMMSKPLKISSAFWLLRYVSKRLLEGHVLNHVAAAHARSARLAGAILRASVSDRERALHHNMTTTPQMLSEGMEHYADHCANCHANNGSGDTMYGRGLNPRPPDLRLAATQSKSDGELYSIIQNGVRMSGMPSFGEPGGHDHGSWELVAFIRHLPSLSPEEELQMESINPITPSEMKERQEEDDFLNGSATITKGQPK